ncbi:hypothetical protein [Herpetosiphon giganteus]|uniref:hypothetical protein n=1 Tax=Herpetosiphon giganteus TaxID=2029754 RepID=UPI00195691EA|nr:hypothetical protein [Herpetosiphon giganteus]
MIGSLIPMLGIVASAIAIALLSKHPKQQLISGSSAVVFWFAVWCLLIGPEYLLFVAYLVWLVVLAVVIVMCINMAKALLRTSQTESPKRPEPKPHYPPITQGDIDQGMNQIR